MPVVLSLLPPTAVTATIASVQWDIDSLDLDWVGWFCTGAAVEDCGDWSFVSVICPSGACINISWAVTFDMFGCSQIGK